MMGERRVAVISDAAGYVGPSLARLLAPEHDLVVGDPEDGLVADLEAGGATVAVAEDVRDLSRPEVTERLVTLADRALRSPRRGHRVHRVASSSGGSCARASTICVMRSSDAWRRRTTSCGASCR